ncbi:RNA-directed DNA polymerase, eukaryota [Tanacetum coccineum]
MYAEESKSINFVNLSDHKAKEANKDGHGNCVNKNSKEDVSSSVCSGHFKKYGVPRTGGSILNLMDELVKVGQVMGYKMDGCMSNMTEIIESQGVKEVNFMALQETKMENMELFSVKMCWGNFAFDYVHSDSVGNSGVGGVWCLTVRDLLIIAVYAPHDCRDKQMLWDYLTYEIGKWKGEVVIMGDFNEMSKLDRFLVSENLIYSCPNINAITLERYLSDHRPILLREASFDYGPTPFRYFHYWNEMEGFNKVVEDAWREGPCDKTNAMRLLIEVIGNGRILLTKEREVVNNIQKFDKIHSSEMAQKAKVKWSIEGDENTSFFHGVLNKKQSILNIRGIMVDGNWIESPKAVNGEFFQHFSSRF